MAAIVLSKKIHKNTFHWEEKTSQFNKIKGNSSSALPGKEKNNQRYVF